MTTAREIMAHAGYTYKKQHGSVKPLPRMVTLENSEGVRFVVSAVYPTPPFGRIDDPVVAPNWTDDNPNAGKALLADSTDEWISIDELSISSVSGPPRFTPTRKQYRWGQVLRLKREYENPWEMP